MIWADFVLIQEALCCSVHQVLGDNKTKTILYNDMGSLLAELFPKRTRRWRLYCPGLLLMLFMSFFPSAI